MSKFVLSIFLAAIFFMPSANAEGESSNKPLSTVSYITPIFSQILALSAPKNFHIDFENVTEKQYILEAVPVGETVKSWTQMLTISGYKGLAEKPNFKPINMVQGVANGFQKACPSSFGAKSIWQGEVSGFEAFAAVITCGTSPMTKGKTSEEALVISIKGKHDFYGIQFAKRNQPSPSPININTKEWMRVLNSLNPIKVCERVKGEKSPYLSCIDKK